MLINLYIENYVLFDKQNLEFKDGFSTIFGDTGAGKSLIIDALSYLCGERLLHNISKDKNKSTYLEGHFIFSNPKTFKLLKENGIEEEDVYKKVIHDDIKKFGIIPELVGRLPIIASLEDLSVEYLIKILTKPKNAIIKQYQRMFSMEDMVLSFNKDALEEIAKIAQAEKTGARGLRAIIEKVLLDIMYHLPDKKDIVKCAITKGVITKNAAPKLTYKEKKIA